MEQGSGRTHVAVIGGGISGLTAAWEIARQRSDVDITVFEGSDQIGGKLRVGEIAGVPVDDGAESMLNRRPEAVGLATSIGLGTSIVHPSVSTAGVWTRGAVRPLPPTLMGIPANLAVAARTGILSRSAVARAGLERRMPDLRVTEDVSVGRLVARRLGRDVRDRLVEPLLGGVYAGRSDELSALATVPQVVEAANKMGSLLRAAEEVGKAGSDAPSTPVFAGITGGVGRLATVLGTQLESRGVKIRLLAMVRDLVPVDGGWRLTIGSAHRPESVQADAVVIACPAAPAARLLRAVAPAAAVELGRIEYASLALVTLAFERGDVDVDLTGSGFLVPPIDDRVIKAATYSSRKWGWPETGPVVVRCSIGRHGDEQVLQRDDTELVEAAVMDLREAVGLHGALLDARVTRWGGGLPQYAVGHLERVARVRSAVAAVPRLEVCGAAFDGVGIPACISTATAAATHLIGELAPVETMGS